jgi:hypothetical protein
MRVQNTQDLQENKRIKNILENVGDDEVLFILDLMKLNGLGWHRLRLLSSFVLGNIRSLAFYASANTLDSCKLYYTCKDNNHILKVEHLATQLRETLPHLENIYLVLGVERKFGSTPPGTTAWRLIPSCNRARRQGSCEGRYAFMRSYAEGHRVKRELVKHLRYVRREHHEKYCEAGNGTSTQSDVASAMASVLGNTARKSKSKPRLTSRSWNGGLRRK